MVVLASSGTKLSVNSRTPHLEGSAITTGDYYEVNYDVTGQNMTQRQSIEFIRALRRRSLDYADSVLFKYAEVKQSSPQTIKYQFKALKSHMSPDPISLGFIISVIIVAAFAAVVAGGVYISLRSADKIAVGFVQPFTPTTTTTYIDPETGDEYGTYEEYAFAYSQRHPGMAVPEPGTRTSTSVNILEMVIMLTVIVVVGFVIYYLYTQYGRGEIGKAGKFVTKQKRGK